MELEKDIKKQLADLLSNPQQVSVQDTALLKQLLQEYPYYQPLHLLLAKANTEEVSTLAKASLYTNGQLLYKFLYANPEETSAFDIYHQPVEIISETPAADEQETFEEISDPYTPISENNKEDEIFEEISEVDLSQYRPFRNSDNTGNGDAATSVAEAPERKSLTDDFVFESIASSDFFAFEESFSIDTVEETPQEDVQTPVPNSVAEGIKPENQVSNYNDEKLPYTFLWWLDKTRKEHQSSFQPYAMPKKEQGNELQQQYVEHIFHVQSHLPENEQLPENTDHPKPVTKDFEIIENFIRKDPQIAPPNAEQIDNENKAKKSAEDQNDLVSETLASIYIEQMLYDKAIDTYEKLSLKFPEKSRYFADLIQSVEKKI
ncbi:MAG: hypothetical protein MUP99_04085 [Pedobacter sp.]|nr:hypothetical protein [Pedobacter sp.]